MMSVRQVCCVACCAVLSCLFCPWPSTAGTAIWTRSGPEGGRVSSLAIDPVSTANVYAATLNGVFKSTNSGASWSGPAGEGNPGLVATIVRAADGALYAALGFGRSGVFKSVDGGTSWSEVNSSNARALAVDRSPTPSVYLAVSGQGVVRSTDAGASWSASDTGIEGKSIQVIAVDPLVPATVYAGTSRDGLFKSTDSGQTWNAANAGFDDARVSDIAIDSLAPANIFQATDRYGVLVSSDSGVSWSPASTGLPVSITSLALDPATPTTVFAGAFGEIYKSINSGGSWSPLTLPGVGVAIDALAVDPSAPAVVYAGTGAGVWKSTDGGATWTEQNSGLLSFYAGQIVVDPVTATTLYAGSRSAGVFKSTDGGATWQAANSGLASREIQDNGIGLAIAASAPATLYANVESDIFKSTNSGASWTNALPDPTVFGDGPFITTIAVDPSDADVVFAGNFGTVTDFANLGAGFYRTTDGGTTWEQKHSITPAVPGFGTFQPTDMAIDPTNPDRVYVGSLYSPPAPEPRGWNLIRSLDGGETWSEVLAGTGSFKFPVLAIDPFSGAVYCAVEADNTLEVFRSTDSGATWAALPVDPAFSCVSVVSLEVDRSGTGALFIDCFTSLDISTDIAMSWDGLATNGLASPITTDAGVARSFAHAGTSPRTLHMGTFGGVSSFTADLADVEVAKADGLTEIESGPLTYTIDVSNPSGPDGLTAVDVADALPPNLTCSWTCAASGGAACTGTPAAGDLADSVDLPRGGSVTYTGSCNLAAAATGTLTNTALSTVPMTASDYQPQNDSATDATLILETGACGAFDDRHLSNQVVSTTLLIEACQSIRADGGFVVSTSGALTFRAPSIVIGSDFSVEGLGAFTVDTSVP